MYNNVGQKVKEYAKFKAGLGIIFSILACIVWDVFAFNGGPNVLPLSVDFWGFSVLLSPLIAILLSVYFWQKYVIIAAFGELVEEAAKASACLEEIKKALNQKQVDLGNVTVETEAGQFELIRDENSSL